MKGPPSGYWVDSFRSYITDYQGRHLVLIEAETEESFRARARIYPLAVRLYLHDVMKVRETWDEKGHKQTEVIAQLTMADLGLG